MRKPTKTQKNIIEAMKDGAVLALLPDERKRRLHLVMGTCTVRNVSPQTLRCLLEAQLIKPTGDGLFGDTQTYSLADA